MVTFAGMAAFANIDSGTAVLVSFGASDWQTDDDVANGCRQIPGKCVESTVKSDSCSLLWSDAACESVAVGDSPWLEVKLSIWLLALTSVQETTAQHSSGWAVSVKPSDDVTHTLSPVTISRLQLFTYLTHTDIGTVQLKSHLTHYRSFTDNFPSWNQV